MRSRHGFQVMLLSVLLAAISIGCSRADGPLAPSAQIDVTFALRGWIYAETEQREVVLPGVAVILTSPSHEPRSTLTRDDGTFVVADLPAGNWTVRVSKPGYVDETVVVHMRGDTTLNFSLSPN